MKATRMILAAFVLVMMAGSAMATEYTYQPGDKDLADLPHGKAYLWGIQPNIAAGETLTHVSIVFKSLLNTGGKPNDIWITLIDSAPLGVTEFVDNQASSNYFAGDGLELAHYHNLPWYTWKLTYWFSDAEIAIVNNYVADNNFGIGIDPDCHFYNCGVELKLVTEPGGGQVPVPEPVAGTILLGGLGVLAARRRRS